jgi:hypothetical protein
MYNWLLQELCLRDRDIYVVIIDYKGDNCVCDVKLLQWWCQLCDWN